MKIGVSQAAREKVELLRELACLVAHSASALAVRSGRPLDIVLVGLHASLPRAPSLPPAAALRSLLRSIYATAFAGPFSPLRPSGSAARHAVADPSLFYASPLITVHYIAFCCSYTLDNPFPPGYS